MAGIARFTQKGNSRKRRSEFYRRSKFRASYAKAHEAHEIDLQPLALARHLRGFPVKWNLPGSSTASRGIRRADRPVRLSCNKVQPNPPRVRLEFAGHPSAARSKESAD
jgi:hypothetical protein